MGAVIGDEMEKGAGWDVRKLKSQFEHVDSALAFARVLMGEISAG